MSKGASGGDKVSVSKDAKLMDEVKASLEEVPVVDSNRVESLRLLVNSGQYQPNLEMVADGLIEEAILRAIE